MVVRTRRRRSRSPAMAWARITPGDPLAVHPHRGRCAVVELGGDPRYPLAAVCLVDPADPVGQLRIRRHPGCACRGGAQPGVEGGSGDLHEFAQPLHLDGVPVVGDERLTSSSPRRNTSPPGAGCPARSRARRSRSPPPLPVPATALPRSVAPGVDRYRSTARRWNSSMSFLRAVIADHLASPAAAGFSVSKIKGQAPIEELERLRQNDAISCHRCAGSAQEGRRRHRGCTPEQSVGRGGCRVRHRGRCVDRARDRG